MSGRPGTRVPGAVLVAALAWGLTSPAAAPGQIFPEEQDPNRPPAPARVLAVDDDRDPRVVEIMRYECHDELRRRDVTLFANGTVRRREGPWERQDMQLAELGPDALRRYVTRLVEIRSSGDFPDQFSVNGTVVGRWLDRCRIILDLPDQKPVNLEVGGLDALPHRLQQVVEIAEELGGETHPLVKPNALPPGYEPKIGDILVHVDGREYEVVQRVPDTGQWELDSSNGLHRMHIFAADMPQLFVSFRRPDRRYP